MLEFPFRVLPGGRRVRDLPSDATVEEVITYGSQSEAQRDIALEAESQRPKPRKGVSEALETDG